MDNFDLKKYLASNPLLNENYMDNFQAYEKEFKQRGMSRHNEKHSGGGYEDIWYKDFPLGRFTVMISGTNLAINNPKSQSKYPEYQYSIFFEPYPKYKKKFFNLIKTKDRQLGKQINFEEGFIDFSEGLFKIDDEQFIPQLFSMVDNGLKKSSEITDVEYLSAEDSKMYSRPAFDDVESLKENMEAGDVVEYDGKKWMIMFIYPDGDLDLKMQKPYRDEIPNLKIGDPRIYAEKVSRSEVK